LRLCDDVCNTFMFRRLLSIVLFAATVLPAIAPALLAGASAESSLPMCCRRNGAHMFPKAVAPAHAETYALAPSAAFFAGVASHPAQFQQVEAWARVALEGARHKRGPPTVRLS
jgi:endonuclease/exonuclease/phosphatase (EEP) superfamily protein YafD